ncbi:MAG: sporulation integral membrane protein YtvI [Clostridiales bacterium]|nr:sporulation integral membrane protein YtvI [Clostridiales bacterium]
MRHKDQYPKILAHYLVAIFVILFFCFVFPKLIRFFMPIVIGWCISILANPIVQFMEKRIRILRKHSSVLIMILALAAVIGVLYGTISVLVKEGIQFINDLPELYEEISAEMMILGDRLQGFTGHLPSGIQTGIQEITANMGKYMSGLLQGLELPSVSQAGKMVKGVAETAFMVIIAILSAYFFLAERESMLRVYRKLVPESFQKKISFISKSLKRAVGGYFKAQIKIMILVAVILFVFFEFLDVHYSFLLALAIAFLDLLPFFGTGAILWPWMAYAFVTGDYRMGIVLLAAYVVCQIVRQVVQPKMVGDSIGVSPFMTLIFMFIGYRIKGVLGLIIGIPVGMVLIGFYKSGVFDSLISGGKIIGEDIQEYLSRPFEKES